VESERLPVRIRRVHLEEDTGKLFHYLPGESEVDFNRAGAPLMEIVTDFPPDLHSAEAAKEYLVQLRAVLTYLGVCDGKMEEGSLRCEPNISVAPAGSTQLGVKTELKNLNSFRAVVRGIEFEVERQIKILESGGQVVQETRGWSEEGGYSFPMRTKEFEQDYRYFPEPDIVPIQITDEWLESLRATIPELPLQKADRYRTRVRAGRDRDAHPDRRHPHGDLLRAVRRAGRRAENRQQLDYRRAAGAPERDQHGHPRLEAAARAPGRPD
jgi:aspartyl-tRNA(Asn)/glutamyl-tRNA(Gln) amidotransferase subunit B